MTEGRIFDAEPHPDERVEWLRAQVEVYLDSHPFPSLDDVDKGAVVAFVKWMEERFMPRGFFDR